MEEILEDTPEKVKGKPGRKPKAQASGSDMEDLVKTLIAQMQAGNTETLTRLAAELRKPTDIEQKKIDDEARQLKKRAEMSVAAAAQKERADQAKIAACRAEGHQDKKGNTRFRAQINSNGYYIPMCQKCQLLTPPIKANPGQISVDMEQWSGINEDSLRNLAARSQQVA